MARLSQDGGLAESPLCPSAGLSRGPACPPVAKQPMSSSSSDHITGPSCFEFGSTEPLHTPWPVPSQVSPAEDSTQEARRGSTCAERGPPTGLGARRGGPSYGPQGSLLSLTHLQSCSLSYPHLLYLYHLCRRMLALYSVWFPDQFHIMLAFHRYYEMHVAGTSNCLC